jgi:hypothetical protein
MELPNPPWYRRWSFILAGVIVLSAGVAAAGLRGLQGVDGPEPTVSTLVSTTTVTSTTAAVVPTTRQPQSTLAPDVLWTKSGSDNGRSRLFRAPAAWHIEWKFDCSDFNKISGGNFKITGDGAFEDIQIQEFDLGASGSRTYSMSGFGHLLVESVCGSWTVTAVAD